MGDEVTFKQTKKRRRFWMVITIGVVSLSLFSCVGLSAGIYLLASGDRPSILSGDAVGVVRLDGVITSAGGDGGLFGEAGISPESFAADLQEAVEDDGVRAIVLRVNSPGGSAAASQEMYEEVKRAAKKKPIVASVSEVAASGSYYAISPADEIMAVRASDIGSIGVFIAVTNLEGLYDKLGIKMDIIKEGKYKAMGDPSKPLTKDERKILQDHAKEIYNQFIDDVAKARSNLTRGQVKKLATGRTWPATQAKELGLVDSFGNYQDAIDRAAKLGKIEGKPQVVTYEKNDWFDLVESGIKALNNIGKLPRMEKIQR